LVFENIIIFLGTHKNEIMKKLMLFLAVIAMLASCKKKSDEVSSSEEVLSENIAIEISGPFKMKDPIQQGNAKFNFLGYGYDITDEYSSANSVRAEIVDISTFSQIKNSVANPKSTQGYWEAYSGENALDLAAKLSNKFSLTKDLKVFGNTIAKAFPNLNPFGEKHIYGYYSSIFIRMSFLVVEDYKNDLKNYLSPNFKQDIVMLNAADLVEKYGTHLLTNINLGSKLSVVYQAEAPKDNRKNISATGLRYAMKRIFELPTGQLDPINLKELNANNFAKIYVTAVGRDQSKLEINNINDRQFINITEWSNSLTEERVKFIGLAKDGLIPLEDFILNTQKKAQVKAYIAKYIGERSVKIEN